MGGGWYVERDLNMSSISSPKKVCRQIPIYSGKRLNFPSSTNERGVVGCGLTCLVGEAHDRLISSPERDACPPPPPNPRDSVCARLSRLEFLMPLNLVADIKRISLQRSALLFGGGVL